MSLSNLKQPLKQQLEHIYLLAFEISLSISDINTQTECLRNTAGHLIDLNPDKALVWLEQLENLMIENNARYLEMEIEEIRDIYTEAGFKQEADRLTQQYNIDQYDPKQNHRNRRHLKSMAEEWQELMLDADDWIDKEPFATVQQVLRLAQKGNVIAAKNALPAALKEIDEQCVVEVLMHKFYLYRFYGIFLLANDNIDEARKILDYAIAEAKQEDSLCLKNSRINWIADLFFYKELYADVIRIMDEISLNEEDSECAHHPFNTGLVLFEIQEGHLNKALEFARQINIPMERYCALDDVLEAYAEKGDIENYLLVAKEFNSRENLCFSTAFSLSDLAGFMIKTEQMMTANEFKNLESQLRELIFV